MHDTKKRLPHRVVEVVSGGKFLIGDSFNARKRHVKEVFFDSLGEKCPTPSSEVVHFSDIDLRDDVLYPHDDLFIISIPINQTFIRRILVDTGS